MMLRAYATVTARTPAIQQTVNQSASWAVLRREGARVIRVDKLFNQLLLALLQATKSFLLEQVSFPLRE